MESRTHCAERPLHHRESWAIRTRRGAGVEGPRFRSPPSARQRHVPKEFQAPEAHAKGEQWPLKMPGRRVRAPVEESR